MVAGMVMPLGELKAIYELLFRDGVMVAKKDKRPQSKHPEIQGVTNLQVMKAMGSLKSQGYVRETFAWRHFYWYLTNEGIVHLRDYLRLPPEIVPSTLQRMRRPASTLDVIRRATNVQTVDGPTSYVPKPTARPGVEKPEFLMDRQGYRHKKINLEEEKQAERMPKSRGPPRNVDMHPPRTSWEQRSQNLASQKSGQEYREKGRRLEGAPLKEIPAFKASQPFNDVNRKYAASLSSEERAIAAVPTKATPLSAAATVTEAFTPTEPNVQSDLTQESAEPSSEPSAEPSGQALDEDLLLTEMGNDKVQVAQEVPTSAPEDTDNKLPARPLEDSVPTETVEKDHHEPPVSDAAQEACESTKPVELEPVPGEVDITEVDYDNLQKASEMMETEGECMQLSEPTPPTLSAGEEQTEDLVLPNLVTEVRETLEVNITEELLIPAQGLDSSEEDAPSPSQNLITELIEPPTEEDTANCVVDDEPEAGFEVNVTEPALPIEVVKANEQTGEVRLITSENIKATPMTSCGASEAEWVEEEQVQSSEETEELASDSASDGEAPVQVDKEEADAPLEATAEVTCDATTPSDVPATKKEVLVVEEVMEILHVSAKTSKTSQNASESVGNLSNSEVNIDHQEELAIERMRQAHAQDPLIQDSIRQKERPFISEEQQDEVDERI